MKIEERTQVSGLEERYGHQNKFQHQTKSSGLPDTGKVRHSSSPKKIGDNSCVHIHTTQIHSKLEQAVD